MRDVVGDPAALRAAAGAAEPSGGPDAAAVVVPDRRCHPVCIGLREPLQLAVPSPG